MSGGQTTVANLFYNMARRQVGLVGLWDVVAFDEVASFKDKDGVQIMKDYMASGSFARGRDAINAYASMVFIGNIDRVDTLVKTSHLFAPFPEAMIDPAFYDRFHAYVPGWEIPKMRPEFFTNQYGLIVDYLADEWLREMRKRTFGDAINKYFKLGRDLNQRDTIAVKHTVSGLLKLLYPNEEYDKEAVRRCLEYALEVRRRVKEQLKKIGGSAWRAFFAELRRFATASERPAMSKDGMSPLNLLGRRASTISCHRWPFGGNSQPFANSDRDVTTVG